MSSKPIIRGIVVAALAGAITIVLAASAQAASGVRPDDRAIHGALAGGASEDPVRPDDRAVRAVTPVQVSGVRPDDRADRSLPNVAVRALSTPAGGFDWSDAGIGAGAFGLVLLIAGASVVGHRLRRPAALS